MPHKFLTKEIIKTLTYAFALLCALIALIWGVDRALNRPASSKATPMTKTLDDSLGTSLPVDRSANDISLILVYKTGCDHCQIARKTIESKLAHNNQYPIQFTQYSYDSEMGQKFFQLYHVHATPLIIVLNNVTHRSYALNTGSTKAINAFIDKYLIEPTRLQANTKANN